MNTGLDPGLMREDADRLRRVRDGVMQDQVFDRLRWSGVESEWSMRGPLAQAASKLKVIKPVRRRYKEMFMEFFMVL
jgi:hypothetical protein